MYEQKPSMSLHRDNKFATEDTSRKCTILEQNNRGGAEMVARIISGSPLRNMNILQGIQVPSVLWYKWLIGLLALYETYETRNTTEETNMADNDKSVLMHNLFFFDGSSISFDLYPLCAF